MPKRGAHADTDPRRATGAKPPPGQSEALLRQVLDTLPAMVGILAPDGTMLGANRLPYQVFQLRVDETIGRQFADMFPWRSSSAIQSRLRDGLRRAAQGEIVCYDEELPTPAGPALVMELWIVAVKDETGNVTHLVVSGIDITDRRQAARALKRSNERLLALSRQLLEAREQERHLLARELHDEIGQALTAAKLNLEGLTLDGDDATVRQAHLAESIATVGRALEQVRARSLDLRPPLLDDLGLTAALRWLTTSLAERGGLHMAFQSTIGDARYDAAVEIAAFRIAQEALNNVVKHARAHRMSVLLDARDGRLHVRIHDDGAGFDVRTARRRATEGASLGLIGMEERARLAGGTIAWRARPGHGTKVDAWFPCGAAVHEA